MAGTYLGMGGFSEGAEVPGVDSEPDCLSNDSCPRRRGDLDDDDDDCDENGLSKLLVV